MNETDDVVMGFSGGVPGLVEASMGRGRTMLLATTVGILVVPLFFVIFGALDGRLKKAEGKA